jgi:hypothetical protein
MGGVRGFLKAFRSWGLLPLSNEMQATAKYAATG